MASGAVDPVNLTELRINRFMSVIYRCLAILEILLLEFWGRKAAGVQ